MINMMSDTKIPTKIKLQKQSKPSQPGPVKHLQIVKKDQISPQKKPSQDPG